MGGTPAASRPPTTSTTWRATAWSRTRPIRARSWALSRTRALRGWSRASASSGSRPGRRSPSSSTT
eukprot:6118745-Alexandrium_andersonii.AAC.1